ncbi:MAG: Fe-S cluster assembly protein SufD [Alphaproteobacteria bacterium]
MSLASVIARRDVDKESWRYTDIEKILATLPDAVVPEPKPISLESNATQLVFIDGVYQPSQSQYGDLPKDIIQGDAKQGYHLVLAGKTCLVTSPIELLFKSLSRDEVTMKLNIELGISGRLTLIERHEMGFAPHILETNIILHQQAKLVHGKIINGAIPPHLAHTKVDVAEGAYYDNFALIKGGRLTRNEIDVMMRGKLAQCTLNGAMLLRDQDHADTTTRISHAAPHGTSRQIYKSVIGGKARAVFQGKIIVAEGAQKTDGHQLSRALLLSDQAEMDAKPELEIYADDVKCSHGSTVGDLDENSMFYLRARGLSEEEARALLIEGFIGEIIDEIHVPAWREICRAEVEEWLHEQN